MSATLTLPPEVRARIAGVARRVRRLRATRGLALLLLVLAVVGGGALLADYLVEGGLPPLVRKVNLVVWAGLGALTFFFALVRPLSRRLRPADLAAAVEERYPELGERLTSSVELATNPGGGNGSPVFIGLLLDETRARSAPLDFRPAVSARWTGAAVALAAVALVAVAAPAVVAPGVYADHARRFLLPWRVFPDFAIEAGPGDAFAARGRPFTFTATLTPRNDRIALPDAVTLVLTEDGEETRLEMPAVPGEAHYALAHTLTADVQYRVEAGNAHSATFTVTAVAPVELAPDSPAITVTPPDYAHGAVEVQALKGLVDLTALRHGDVRFDFAFTRPAVAGRLEFTATAVKKGRAGTHVEPRVRSLPLELSPDRTAATVTLPALASGTFRVVLEAEHGVVTARDGGALRVHPDLPPRLVEFAGKEDGRAARPADAVAFRLRLADDVAVARADLLYTINGSEKVSVEPLVLDGAGKKEAVARAVLKLEGKVKAGDKVGYRVRFSDNLPKKFKGPHTVYHPADCWRTLRVVADTSPLLEKEITAQRDDVRKRLDEVLASLKQQRRGVYKVREESHDGEPLEPEHVDKVKELRDANAASAAALRKLAKDYADDPALAGLAARAAAAGEEELRPADDALAEAAKPAPSAPRSRHLGRAEEKLKSAIDKLEKLRDENDQIAQERLDLAKVEELAARQKKLADQAAELAARHPALDPEAKKLAEQIAREQKAVADELDKLAQKSDALRQALEDARAEQAKEAAEHARELAKAQRDLAKAADETDQARRAERLAALAERQRELAGRAERLAGETEKAARAASRKPLSPESAKAAADELKKGDARKALAEQDRSAADLERLARELDRAFDLAKEPRTAAQQLSRLQDDLAKRVKAEAARKDARPLAERLEPLLREQKAIEQAAERVSVPPTHRFAQTERQKAADEAARAAQALEKGKSAEALASMEKARHALERLGNSLPALRDREAQARREADRLLAEQRRVARRFEESQRGDKATQARRLDDAAKMQAEVAEALAKLDAPRHEARRERAREALERAQADLMDGRRDDADASQKAALRELERLAEAVRGGKPADERAAELAKRQRELAAEAAKAAADPKVPTRKLDELKRRQRELADQAKGLDAREAPLAKAEAEKAAAKARLEADKQPTSPAARAAMDEAGKKLDELARRMAGEEADADKARRLAREQADAAGKPPTEEAKRRERAIAEEAKGLRGGDEAKRKALEALGKAEAAKPDERPQAQREAADALRELADELAGKDKKKPDDDAKKAAEAPRKTAEELARAQRELTAATQAAAKKPAAEGAKALDELAKKQKGLNDQAAKLPPGESPKALHKARAAMDKAREALERKDAPTAQLKQKEAATALESLARKLPEKATARRPEPKAPEAKDPSRPTKDQVEATRQLAKEQRELQRAVLEAEADAARADRTPRSNPAGDLAKAQAEIAREAAELAKGVGKELGDKSPATKSAKGAGDAAADASAKMGAGALPDAEKAGKKTAEGLRDLAKRLAETPRGKAAPGAPDPLQQARRLAKEQDALLEKLAPLAKSPEAQRAQQLARQAELEREAGDLAKTLERLGHEMTRSPGAKSGAREAAGAAREAGAKMREAGGQTRHGDARAKMSREGAARALDRAAAQAGKASAAQADSRPAPARPDAPKSGSATGQAVQQAKGEMGKAQAEMGKGQPRGAQASMQKAADALQRLAGQMRPPTAESSSGAGSDGVARLDEKVPPLGIPSALRRWGELSGEARSAQLQQLKAKYGDDYARMIQLYFEQLADTKKRK